CADPDVACAHAYREPLCSGRRVVLAKDPKVTVRVHRLKQPYVSVPQPFQIKPRIRPSDPRASVYIQPKSGVRRTVYTDGPTRLGDVRVVQHPVRPVLPLGNLAGRSRSTRVRRQSGTQSLNT